MYFSYDNNEDEMAGIFVGSGPNFKPGVVVDSMSNVDIYVCNTNSNLN